VINYNSVKLRDARLMRGLTQIELARATKLSPSTVNLVELGKGPWLKALRTIANFLNVPLEDFILPTGAIEDEGGKNRRRKAS